MKRFTVILLLIHLRTFAQKDSVAFNNNDLDEYNTWNTGITFRIDIGVFSPLDNLKKTFSTSPNIAFYFGLPIAEKYRLDLGTNLFIPTNSNKIKYYLNDTTLVGNPILSGTLGFWITRIDRFNKKIFWDNRIGSGLGFLQTDIPTNKPASENDNSYSSETIFLNLGTGLRTIVFRRKSLGFSLNYFLVPYNAFKRNLSADFGMQYLTSSIAFTF